MYDIKNRDGINILHMGGEGVTKAMHHGSGLNDIEMYALGSDTKSLPDGSDWNDIKLLIDPNSHAYGNVYDIQNCDGHWSGHY